MDKHKSLPGFTTTEMILMGIVAAVVVIAVMFTLPGVLRAQRDKDRQAAIASLVSAYSEFIVREGEHPKHEAVDVLCLGVSDSNPDCPLDGYALGAGLKYVIRGDVMRNDEVVDVFTLDNNGSGIVNLFRGARCGEHGEVLPAPYWRNVAGVIRLEGNGTVFFCQNG